MQLNGRFIFVIFQEQMKMFDKRMLIELMYLIFALQNASADKDIVIGICYKWFIAYYFNYRSKI